MAAKSTEPQFLLAVLQLPHLFWGEKDAKEAYPDDWSTGSQNVTLHTYVPVKKNAKEHYKFTADDGEDYCITMS
jgi:hypothetical protein